MLYEQGFIVVVAATASHAVGPASADAIDALLAARVAAPRRELYRGPIPERRL